jgi:hypothetical protein
MLVIRALNLKTMEAWDAATAITREAAVTLLENLRKRRGHWKDDHVVHAIVDPETKAQHNSDEEGEAMAWIRQQVLGVA